MTWNPFDWTAGPFLTFYLTMAAIVFLAGYSLRLRIGPAAHAARKLNALELAYLSGGARRVGDAALLSLMSANAASIGLRDHRITVTDQTPLGTMMGRPTHLPVEPGMTRQQFQTAVKPLVERIQTRLQDIGYCPTDEQMLSFRMTFLPFVMLLIGTGFIKAAVGEARHHPIGILVILLMLTAFAGFLLAQRPTRTRAGADVLEKYQSSHARASRAPLDHELVLAVALSGAVVLSGTPYASVYAASKTMSGSGDGGGGCGGGGGGGGGCGGCS
ncbi:TIGR04222 domain-containing membrane protein [Bradyrhizobium sp. Cp5.3]|uniref:TIGR04222 domain-containing membrane protein n=1 Tax=Bradyrhizobium sp. Cp5.3 TaxID=443598 RepID=UPI00040ABBDF|nr:TIGR04222 domain-containing membrane protein [Bradyrhizobium sp. Cp5.3]